MPELPAHPSLEHLRKQAKRLRRERGIPLALAQRILAGSYGFASWPRLVRHVEAASLSGIDRALALADPTALAAVLAADPDAATTPLDGLAPLLVLLRRSAGTGADVRACTRLLLSAGADPDSRTDEGDWGQTALFDAVERDDATLVQLLIDAGAAPDDDAFYHACEHGDTTFLDLLYAPGDSFDSCVNHKLDFEDEAGLRWFLARDIDVNANRSLHHAILRGRGVGILTLLLDAGADVNLPWDRWDVGRRPLALAARSGHLAAYDLLLARGASADLDPVDAAALAVARGESTRLPKAGPPGLGTPGRDYGWLLGQLAGLGRTEVVRSLLDAGMAVDTRCWSNFSPLEAAAMHGRAETVRLLIERGADLADLAWGDHGPTPLDCALWGVRNNRAADGDYPGTVAALLVAGAPYGNGPTGDPEVDALLAADR